MQKGAQMSNMVWDRVAGVLCATLARTRLDSLTRRQVTNQKGQTRECSTRFSVQKIAGKRPRSAAHLNAELASQSVTKGLDLRA